MSLLDDITKEVSGLSDDEIAAAAAQIQAKRLAQRSKQNTPERRTAMKAREQKKRAINKEIMRLAKEKGLLGTATANVDANASANLPGEVAEAVESAQ